MSGGAAARHHPPLLLVHGICHGAWCWQPNFAPHFAGLGYDVRAISLRGHGGSEGRSGLDAYGLEDYADDVCAVAGSLDRLPILVGHSMGGAIVQLVLRRRPGTVHAAVLLAPMVPGGLTARELLGLAASPARVAALVRLLRGGPLTAQQANRLPFFDRRLDAQGAAEAASRLQPESRRALRDLRAFAPPAGPLPVPLLVIGSRLDRIFGEAALRRTAAHYGVEPIVLDEGSHDLMLDPCWRTSAIAIAEWIAGCV